MEEVVDSEGWAQLAEKWYARVPVGRVNRHKSWARHCARETSDWTPYHRRLSTPTRFSSPNRLFFLVRACRPTSCCPASLFLCRVGPSRRSVVASTLGTAS